MRLSDVLDTHSVQLEQLEDLQCQLYQLLVEKYGATVAAGVLGRALAGALPSQYHQKADEQHADCKQALDGAAVNGAATPAQAQKGMANAVTDVDKDSNTSSKLDRSISVNSDTSETSDASDASSRSRNRWHHAVALARASVADPWKSRGLHKLPMEVVVRYRYTAATRQWVKDNVLVKMESQPFAAGAMRECYAMKKLSTFSSSVFRDWKRAPNFVAKRYKKPVDRDIYFADVVLQMDAKFLGDEYSKIPGVPKKVDFMQAAVIEFKDRPGKPVLAVEHLIEGPYVKYSSNSGYVASTPLPPASPAPAALNSNGELSKLNVDTDGSNGQQQSTDQQQAGKLVSSPSLVAQEQAVRSTPQAFSHFTFEFTQGSALCVDIQGVGDLYTDPQIHTLDGQGYGDGNLALRGMALFFRTHECNMLCTKLGLKAFDRCAPDVAAQGYASSSSTCNSGTMFRTFSRHCSISSRLLAHRKREQQMPPFSTLDQLTRQLQAVPEKPAAEALIHWEIARLYAETVTLPELRPDEDPDAARAGGLFHLAAAAAKGVSLAQLVLACGHMGLQPSSTQLSHLLKECTSSGEFQQHPQLALRYTQLAAERGIRSAAAALAYAYTTGEGVGHGATSGPQPAAAVKWLRQALAADEDQTPELFSQTPDGLNPRAGSGDGKTLAPAPAAPKPPKPKGVPVPRSSPATPGPLRRQIYSCKQRVSGVGPCIGDAGVTVGSLFTIADQLSTAATAAVTAARAVFEEAAEEEGKLLPGGERARYELLADLGELLLVGHPGDTENEAVQPDPAAAAEAFNEAAEEAAAAFKGKLSQRYFEKAAEAEAAAEAVEVESCAG